MEKKKIIKKTIWWVVYLVVLIGLIYGIPKGLGYLLETEHPMASITSGSMWPALKRGDLVFIEGIDNKDQVKEGDIIVYRNARGFTIHRITQLNEDNLITKGDANNGPDSPINYEDIIGKTLLYNDKPLRIPLLGNVSILINKKRI